MVKSGIEVYTETRGSITLQTKGSKVFSLSAKADRIESADSSVTIIGNPVVSANTSGSFRIKITSTTTDSESCTLFRLG